MTNICNPAIGIELQVVVLFTFQRRAPMNAELHNNPSTPNIFFD